MTVNQHDGDGGKEHIDDQLNFDRYTNHFSELKSSNRGSLFILYNNIKLGS